MSAPLEIANGLARIRFRKHAIAAMVALQSNNYVEVVPATASLFEEAFQLFSDREDKDWGLTDCSSFIVMRDRGVRAALTTDRHFIQAGFEAPLLSDAKEPS